MELIVINCTEESLKLLFYSSYGHSYELYCVASSPDGKLVASACKVWLTIVQYNYVFECLTVLFQCPTPSHPTPPCHTPPHPTYSTLSYPTPSHPTPPCHTPPHPTYSTLSCPTPSHPTPPCHALPHPLPGKQG